MQDLQALALERDAAADLAAARDAPLALEAVRLVDVLALRVERVEVAGRPRRRRGAARVDGERLRR